MTPQYNKILFLEDKRTADFFIDEIYKHNVELLIVTGDNTYPEDKEYREEATNRILNDETIQIVVLSRHSMKHLINAKTTNILLLHDLIESNLIHSDKRYIQNYNIGFNKQQLAWIIHVCLLLNIQNKYITAPPTKNKSEFYNIDEDNKLSLKWECRLIYPDLPSLDLEVEETDDWEEVKEYWNKTLWPDREDTNPMSSMILVPTDPKDTGVAFAKNNPFTIDYDMEIYDKYKPTFFVIRYNNKIIGINSGHKCGDITYRSRGLFVDPEHRKKGLAQLLIRATIKQAREEGCLDIWTYPRGPRGPSDFSSMRVYHYAGFSRKGDWINDGKNPVDAPNCIAMRQL